MADQITTVQDMMDIVYPPDMKEFRIFLGDIISKADDPVLSTTSGWTNPIYGRAAFNWLNMKSNIWKLIPKKPWDNKTGWRVITADETATEGCTETGTLPDSDKPTWRTMKAGPKYMMSRWDMSEHAMFYSEHDDSLTPKELQKYYSLRHPKAIDEFLGKSYDAYPSGDTRGTYAIESIDRIVGSQSEATNIYHDATSADIYKFTYSRSAGVTTFDAYVDLDTTDTDRDLTLTMIDDLIENADTFGADRNRLIFLTGYNTYMDWNALLEAKQRFLSQDKIGAKITMNGVEALGDVKAGFQVASYDGIPIFTGQNVAGDTKKHIYLLDLDNLFIKIAYPTVSLTTGKENFLLVDKLQVKYAFLTGAELICHKFNTQGKIINLK